jgi:hypothetical protein
MTDAANNPKFERAKGIANEIIEMADMVAKNTRIAFPPKRLFRKKGKRPLKRLKRQQAMIALGMAPEMTRMRMKIIMAQPTPNYVFGGVVPGSPAIVGESGKELIITPNGYVNVPTPHKYLNKDQ